MTPREAHQLWLRDMLEHLRERQEQLEWTEDTNAQKLLLDGMARDLEAARRLCETMKARLPQRAYAAV